jgi:hypothetical protein
VAGDGAGHNPDEGFDFGAYHFHMNADRKAALRIKAATIAKIRRRIKLLTRIPGGGIEPAPADERDTGPAMLPLIHKVSALLGFQTTRADDVHGNRYILYRLKRVAKALGGAVGDGGQFRRRMRDMGLRTFIDAWMRHPRPDRY